MSKRNYNVFFNTHTVSGIIISIGLFVIFFAGAFTLFWENINHWEANEPSHHHAGIIDYERVLEQVEAEGYAMHGRNLFIHHHEHIEVFSGPLTDSTLRDSELGLLPDSISRGSINLSLDEKTYAKVEKQEVVFGQKLGGFIYLLHFFDQIPRFGRYLSGLIAVFFLFAIVTGVIVHWDKILSFFFTFRLKSSLKNLWTDAHTTMGMIGLPFQFMYAITGAYFTLIFVLAIPFLQIFHQGDFQAGAQELSPSFIFRQFETKGYSEEQVSINELVKQSFGEMQGDHAPHVEVTFKNYRDQNAHVGITLKHETSKNFFNSAEVAYRLSDGQKIYEQTLEENPPYAVAVMDTIAKLHFGNYGGYFLKILYFLLALLTCLVIISGVMVWLKAREKNKKYLPKRKFNTNVGAIYLGSCLGLYPAIALMFILTKTFPENMAHRFDWIRWLFLAFWMGYTVYSYIIKDYFKINKHALILAGAMGVLIPILNGVHSGLWLWKSFPMGYSDSFFVDLAWLVCGGITLYIGLTLKPKKQEKAEIEDKKEPVKVSYRSTTSVQPKIKVPEPALNLNTSAK